MLKEAEEQRRRERELEEQRRKREADERRKAMQDRKKVSSGSGIRTGAFATLTCTSTHMSTCSTCTLQLVLALYT